MMKRFLIFGLMLAIILAFSFGGAPLKADYQPLTIESVSCTNGLDPGHTPYLMLDDDLGTAWRTSATSPAETGLVITLSAKARILGLKLVCSEINFDRLSVEYEDHGTWRPFTGWAGIKPETLDESENIDLSYDNIKTNLLRLHIYNNGQYTYLGSIASLMIFGTTEEEETVIPVETVDTPNRQELFKAANLIDGNTNSNWETTPDGTGSAQVVLNFPVSGVSRVKLFNGPGLKGVLALSYWQDNRWVTLPGAERITSMGSGWNSIFVYGITTSKLRMVFTNPKDGRLGGIAEVEIWGKDTESAKLLYDSGLSSSSFGGFDKSYAKVIVPQLDQKSKYYLILATTGGIPGQVSFNGTSLPAGQPFCKNSRVALYKIPVQPLPGHTEEFNTPGLNPAWFWVRENKANWSLTANNGYLTINTEYGELLNRDNNMKNILLRQAPAGDWTISAKIDGQFAQSYEQAGLIVYQDDDNFISIEPKYDYGEKMLCWKETSGQPSGEYFHNIKIPNPCFVKIIKLGNDYQCLYSADNTNWQLVKLWQNINFTNIKVGLFGSNGFSYQRPPFQGSVQFDWFNLEGDFRQPGGGNFVTVDGTEPGEIVAVKIEEQKANGLLTNWTTDSNGLNDGLLFTRSLSTNLVDLQFTGMVHADRLTVYSMNDLGQVQVQTEGTNGWVTVSASQTQTPGVCRLILDNSVKTKRLRLILPAMKALNEIQCWGSPVTEGAPQLQIDLPVEGQIVHPYDHTFQVTGRIDQTGATVTVNGSPVTLQGGKFSTTLCPWQDEKTFIVTITARNNQNQTTTVKRTVFLSGPPLLALDQTASEYFVKDPNFTISGTADNHSIQVTINGIPVNLNARKFSHIVNLKEGRNFIAIQAVDNQGLHTDHTITVYCDSQPPQLKIYSPGNGQTVTTSSLTVSGAVSDISRSAVKINGKDAMIDGSNFSGTVTLVPGPNTITVTAKDTLGNESTATLNVKYFTSKPALTVEYPANNQPFNTGKITVKGTVSDSLPVMVDVNNIQAKVAGNVYQIDLTLPEGWNTLQVRAANEAGAEVKQILKVFVDETKPLDFAVTANPADWANNNRPVLTFATTDQISGVDRYELAVDDGEFIQVTSPYKLPVTPDGEHLVTVKAIDKLGWETTATAKVYIDTTPPSTPAEFKAVPGDKKIIVSWKPNTESDFKKYIVKRFPAFPDGDKEFNINTGQYTDSNVENFQSYTYSIKTLDHIDNTSQEAATPSMKPGLAQVPASPQAETRIEYENVAITIPKGALAETKAITIMEVKNPPALEDSMGINVSKTYEFSAATAQSPVTPGGVRFEKPVMVGIHYTLEGMYQYIKKNNLRAYYYNYKNENWEVIPASYVDPNTDTVYFLTDHFSMFSVQASMASPMSAEQISGMGVSPGKEYNQNNQVGISYGSGSSSVTAKDFVLPGKGGMDLTLSRSYDSNTAQADWGLDEQNVIQAMVGFVDFGNPFLTAFVNFMARQLDHVLSGPASTYGFGRGWRLNAVWVEKNDNGQFVHLPGGGMKKINWTMDGSGPGGQGHGRFECHAGEHFILEKNQVKQADVQSVNNGQGSPTNIGETWVATDYTLTIKDGTKYYMNKDGLLTRIVNRLGTSEINFTYNGKNIDHIIDSTGRRIDFTYSGKMISSITAAGRTVNYSYNNDELTEVNDAGMQKTKYGYREYGLKSAASTLSLVDIVIACFEPTEWINIIMGMIPFEREDKVYYLAEVTTPFGGQYTINYTTYRANHYAFKDLTYVVAYSEIGKATQLTETGSGHTKVTNVEYKLVTTDHGFEVAQCNVREGTRRTEMTFSRYSNSVDESTSMLKSQTVYGEHDRRISEHTVLEFDPNLEVPTKVIDQTGNRDTVVTFEYDNWGNVTKQTNSKTGVEAYYSYANTNAPAISQGQARSSPYGNQNIPKDIHDAKIGELILNKNGDTIIPQQTWYKYDATSGNLMEKAIRSGDTWLKTRYEYDTYGNIVKMFSPSGIETGFEYSDQYNNTLLTKVTLAKLTDANGGVRNNVVLREVGYDPVTYRKRWEKDARGFVTEYQQDVLGREVKTVLPDDDDPVDFYPTVISGDIDRGGCRSNNPCQQVIFDDGAKTSTVIDPMGNRTIYIYDAFEHLLEIHKYKKSFLGLPYVYSKVKVGYDDQWNITSIISPNGVANPDQAARYTTTYEYDETNRLKKIIYPYEETLKCNPYKYYDYNDVANSVTVTDENGHDTKIQKDEVDRVIRQDLGLRAEEGTYATYTYDALGNKTSETDGRDNTTLFVYDDLNRLVRRTLPAVDVLNNPNDSTTTVKSSQYRYEYNSEGNLVKEISPLGSSVIHEYDEMDREIRTTTSFTVKDGVKKTTVIKSLYDLTGNKIEAIKANGKSTRFEYTARGYLKRKIDPNDGVTSFTYDLVGNKTSETDPRGNMSGAAPNSFTAWYYYDELYRIVKAVLPDKTPPSDPNSPGDNPVIMFEYDYDGNCIKETKANGQVITYVYDGRYRLLSQSESLNGKIYTSRFEYDGVGNKKFVYDNKGNKTEYVYDALNRLVRTVFPEGNTISYKYDKNGNKIEAEDGKHNRTITGYNALNQVIQVTDAENVDKPENDQKSTQFYYNEEGKLTKQVSPTSLTTKFFLNELGMPLRVVDSLGQSRYFDYDAAGNVTYKKDPRGTEVRFKYDDMYRILQTSLQNGSRTQSLSYQYDIVGNLKKADNGQVKLIYNNADSNYDTDPFNRISKVEQVMLDGTRYTTEYRYDIMGQMTGIRYPKSAEWLTYDYDAMGRLVGIPGFAGGKDNPGFTYDDNSALESVKTDNGVTTTYQRDKNGRITGITAAKSGANILSLTYVFDDANRIIQRNDNSYVYDKVSRLTQATIRGVFEDTFTKADMEMGAADKDYSGNKASEQDVTDLTQVKLDYSARSLILDLQTDAENICRVELTPERTGHRVPVDQIEVYYLNGFVYQKLERDKWTGFKDENGHIILKFTPVLTTRRMKIHCNYDDLDYMQRVVDRSEFYNAPEKLVTVYQKIYTRTESYQYDAMGNRLNERILLRKERTYGYDYYPNSNWLMKSRNGQYAYNYDANGNLTEKGNKYTWDNVNNCFVFEHSGDGVEYWQYSYDLLNQLEQVKKNGQVLASYIYDPNGFRVEKVGSKGKIDYVPLLNGEVGYRKEISTGKEYSFIYVGGTHLARVNGVVGGEGKKFFYLNDHEGSALAVTDENGNKIVDRDFAPFGEKIKTNDREEPYPEETEDGFTGKDWDEDVGLYYFNARWYDSTIGRFTTEDSVADDPNLYSYCGQNPVNNVDPTGHAAQALNIGWQSGLGLAGAMIGAVAKLGGDSTLGNISSAFSLFVTIKSAIWWARYNSIYWVDTKNNQPIPEERYQAEYGIQGSEGNADVNLSNPPIQGTLCAYKSTSPEDDLKKRIAEAEKNIPGFKYESGLAPGPGVPGLTLENQIQLYIMMAGVKGSKWEKYKQECLLRGAFMYLNTINMFNPNKKYYTMEEIDNAFDDISFLVFAATSGLMEGIPEVKARIQYNAQLRAGLSKIEGELNAPLTLSAPKGQNPWMEGFPILNTVLEKDTIMYRVWGGGSEKIGKWLTPFKPESSFAAISGNALPSTNSAYYYSEVLVPAGTRIQLGVSGPAFGQPGGGIQVQLMSRIPIQNYGPGQVLTYSLTGSY
jgi:RHS repeat-associated protein